MAYKEIENITESYIKWIKDNIHISQINEYAEFTTPFLDRHNDHIQVYASEHNGSITLTDDGYTIADLEMSGMEFKTTKRREVLDSILNSFGAKLEGENLCMNANSRDIGQKMHMLIQTIISVNDTFVLSQPSISGFFWDDVNNFLLSNDIRYSPRVNLVGKSGFGHNIDFLISASKEQPERMIKVLNSPDKNSAGQLIFAFNDLKENRLAPVQPFAVLNDKERSVSSEVTEAFHNYKVEPILWSEKENYVELLAG